MLLLSDYRYASRTLVRTPAFALLAVLTLGLGIGANTAIFSAMYRLQIAPLPFESADRLVNLGRTRLDEGFFLSPDADVVREWQQRARTVEHVAMVATEEVTLTGSGEAALLKGGRVSASLFDALGMKPLIGRVFTVEDAAATPDVVVLSEGVWRTRFGGDPAVLGRQVQMSGQSRTVIGVMPAAFARFADPFPRQDYWTPHVRQEMEFTQAYGVMKAGVTPDQVGEELALLAAGVEDASTMKQTFTYRAVPIVEMLSVSSKRIMPLLLGAVALVLLIACANVAGLMIVRLNSRRRELAIRSALGARKYRILAVVAAEQILLAVGAGVCGVLLAVWTMELIGRFRPRGTPMLDSLALEPAVLIFALLLLVGSLILSGVLPAAFGLRGDPADALRSGGDRVTGATRARSVLVAAQIAVSVVLLVGAGLLIRSYGELLSRDLGFRPENALAVEISLPEARYTPAQKPTFYEELLVSVRSMPGVVAAEVGGGVPPHLGLLFGSLQVAGSDVSTKDISYVSGTSAAPGFLTALGVRFVEGADFEAAHRDMNAVVVNRAFAEKFWPGQSGVGQRMKIASNPDAPWIEIVGVIESIRASHTGDDDLQVFYPITWDYPSHHLIVRTDGSDPNALVPAIRKLVARMDPNLALRDVATLEAKIGESISRERFVMLLLSVFAAIALVLTAVGLYSLIAYSVQQRVREIGIRVALGATTRSVRELFVMHGMRLVGAGLLLGAAGAIAAVRLLRTLVYGIGVYDPLSFALAITLIGGASLLASWLPARRASRVDPLVALKND